MLERKQIPVSQVRGVDPVDGIVEAIVSVTNIVDNVNDIILPGAYKNTLKKRNPKVVWSHDTNIPVGKTLKVEELLPGDQRLPADLLAKDAGALLVKMQFNLNTSRGRDAYEDVQFFGPEQEWSIGYAVPDGKSVVDSKTGIRRISQLELYEYSPVIFGAAPNTRTTSLKNEIGNAEAKAIPEDVSVGSTVSFAVPKPPDKTEYAKGIVEKIVRSGEVRLPDTSESMEATTLDPVAIIKVYARMDDDQYEETDRRVVKKISSLRVIDEFRNEEKSADDETEEKAPSISASVEKTLKQKVADHNEKYGDSPAKRATYAMLAASYRRGIGAYRTNPSSVRPTVSSAEQWAMARVNGLLYALRTGRFRRTAYDTDLLPEAHSLSTRGKGIYADSYSGEIKAIPDRYSDLDFSIPDGVKTQAETGLNWANEYNRGGTSVGKATARYLINNSNADWRKVFHISAYFARHENEMSLASNSEPGADGYPGNGLIAWKLWGGNPGRTWSQKLVKAMQSRDEDAGMRVVRGPGGRVAGVRKKDIFTDSPSGEPSSFGEPQRISEGKPYRISSNAEGCDGYAVVKVGESSPVPGGCHASLSEARAHMTALNLATQDEKEMEIEDEPVGMSEHQLALYEAYEEIVSINGQFDQSSMANGAHYASADANPFKEQGMICANCVFYEGGQRCHIVSGTIEPNAICKLWVIPENLISEAGKSEAIEEEKSLDLDEKAAGPNGKVMPKHKTDVDMARSWDKTIPYRRMKSPADTAYYSKIFAYQNPNTEGDRKTHYNFIHHFVDANGNPGAASYAALINSMAVLNGGRSGTVLRGAARRAVYEHIASHYRDAGKTPPELKSDEDVDAIMIQNGIIHTPLTEYEDVEVKAVGRPIPSHSTPVQDSTTLTRAAILAVRSPESKDYYEKIFAYQMPNTDGTRKTHYTFIHHNVSEDGRAGAAAMSELRVQMSVLNGARSGTTLRGEARKAVYNHLARHYRDAGKTPPELKSDEYLDELMIKNGIIDSPLTKEEESHE
jgi:HK97 family phage prohead protease